jgi:hypothetical protein
LDISHGISSFVVFCRKFIVLPMNANTKLVSAEECIAAVFSGEKSRPALRTFREWQSRGYLPFHKIGKRTFFDPDDVRRALDRRFKIEAKPVL